MLSLSIGERPVSCVLTRLSVCPLCSKTISACLTRLYQSVAELIRWADQVMLQGVAPDSKESTASVTTVIRAVLDGIKVRK